MKFIELTTYEGMGDTTFIKKVSVNPDYIVAIEEDEGRSIVRLSDKSAIKVVEARAEILMMLGGVKQFVG